jgi:hypothetical protein
VGQRGWRAPVSLRDRLAVDQGDDVLPKGEPLRAVCTMKLTEVKMLAKTDSAG